jgi:hypothetical protein
LLDRVDDLIQTFCRNRAFLAGLAEPQYQLITIKIDSATIALDNEVRNLFDPLVGSVPAATVETFSPAANRESVSAFTGIDYAISFGAAERALHPDTAKSLSK